MPQESYPFPMYSGLLDPKHYKKIGSAIWLFLWCVSSTTKDVEKDGVSWGIVLGNKPIKREEISAKFDVTERTVQRWIDTLEQEGYIKITRAPYGMIFSVRNSKKFPDRSDKNVHSDSQRLDKNVQSLPERVDKNVQSPNTERTKMSSLSDKNVHSNKDITVDIKKDTTTTTKPEQAFEEVMNTYCEIHRKLDINVKPLDIMHMQEVIALGVPSPLITRVMRLLHQERTAKGARITSFAYYKTAILDAWESEKAITDGVPIPTGLPAPTVALGSPKRTKQQQQQFDELDRLIAEEEAKQRGTR